MDQKNHFPFSIPDFKPEVVADQLRDGYWIESPDIDGDGNPDLFGYGLALGEIYWYQAPDWTPRLVADRIRMPVGGDYADISGDGSPDIVVSYELYGPIGTIHDADPQGGKIAWYENPNQPDKDESRWRQHYVGRTTGTHRLRAGHFTQRERLEIIGFPIVTERHVHSVLPIVLFTQPDDVHNAEEWTMTVIDDCHFRMLHGAEKKHGIVPGNDLDSLLLASDEGVTWLYYDERGERWKRVLIGTGERTQFQSTGFRGSGDMDAGGLAGESFSYVAALEPFHGNTVAVYVKEDPGASAENTFWKRHLLDVYGDPNENGEGPGHQIVCADFDGDGDDEFLVALRGPWPWQGVMYYKAIDAANGVFTKWRVTEESVARIATGDFNGDGRLDFATIAYSVRNYYVAQDAKMMLYRNEIGRASRELTR